jgi:hypothetical protein
VGKHRAGILLQLLPRSISTERPERRGDVVPGVYFEHVLSGVRVPSIGPLQQQRASVAAGLESTQPAYCIVSCPALQAMI